MITRAWWKSPRRWWNKPMRIEIPKPPRAPREHSLILEPRRAFVLGGSAIDGTLVLGGWNPHHYLWKDGDYFVIELGRGLNTRYRIEKLEYGYGMFTARCSFAPRGTDNIAQLSKATR